MNCTKCYKYSNLLLKKSPLSFALLFLPFLFSYARTAYCDVTGRESRLPLRIRGDGAGPKVHFSLGTLDIGNVFINSKHSYEVFSNIIYLKEC